MDVLEIAAADITLLIVSCRAARDLRLHALTARSRAHWHHLCSEFKRATVAYATSLARVSEGDFGESSIESCRAAAQREMQGALAAPGESQSLCRRVGGPGDTAIVTDDLSRLSHLASQVGRNSETLSHWTHKRRRRVLETTRYVQQQVRRAILAYALESVRGPGEAAIRRARVAATGHLNGHCAKAVANLSGLTADGSALLPAIEKKVGRPLRLLRKAWKRDHAGSLVH